MLHFIPIFITLTHILNVLSFHSINYNRKFIHDHSNILPTTTATIDNEMIYNKNKRSHRLKYQYNSFLLSATNDDTIGDSNKNNDSDSNNSNIEKNDFAKFENNNIMDHNDVMILDGNNMDTIANGDTIMGDSNSNQVKSKSDSSKEVLWDVYICQLKNSKERGADATLGAFIGLSPPNVSINTAYIHKSKGKGPTIRCIQRNGNVQFEVNNVDSVDKVYTILTKYMNLKNIDPSARECFKYNYKGNAHLDKNEITQAIQSYNIAISTGYKQQEGIILVMRATAYLQRAFNHRNKLKLIVSELEKLVTPTTKKINTLYELSNKYPIIGNNILYPKFIDICRIQDNKFQQIKYRHGLYENSLLHATKDSLRATQLLPNYAKTWLRAGDSLAELRKYKESASYYEKALELDGSLEYMLKPMIKELEDSQVFLDNARASGWSDDTLRISLDVAG